MSEAHTAFPWDQRLPPLGRFNKTDPWDEAHFLTELRRELARLFGDRLTAVLLYGSRARGDAAADSDYDIAVFLRDRAGFGDLTFLLADLSTTLMFRSGGRVAHFVACDAADQVRRSTMLMENIRREGRVL